MAPPPIISFDEFSRDLVIATLDEIRMVNPQRFEMEQLSGILHFDQENHIAVGYKEITPEEFWVRGHMPDYPLMPGVMMCEVAAQLSGYYSRRAKLMDADFMGFGGLEDVRFRSPVYVGDCLIIMTKLAKLRARRAEFEFQGYVNQKLVYHGRMLGVPIQKDRVEAELDL